MACRALRRPCHVGCGDGLQGHCSGTIPLLNKELLQHIQDNARLLARPGELIGVGMLCSTTSAARHWSAMTLKNAMRKTFKATLIATAIAAFPFGAAAAGLGAVNVFSGLGQPLRAEIEVKATSQELQSLTARVAGADAFRQANFTMSPVISDVRLNIERRGDRAFLKVSSQTPVRDPFLDLVVELNWSAGRILREYTFLLDPVDTARPVVATSTAAPAARPTPAQRAISPPPATRAPAAMPDSYRVARGDTLRAIASRFQQPGANLDQMLIALLRENPDAFDGGNINRLRAGAVLRLPSSESALATEPATARREVVAQAADFEAYRNRLAGTVRTRAEDERQPTRESAGAIVPRVEAPIRADEASDRVEVSGGSGDAPVSTDAERLARLQALEEELIAREKSLQDANARLLELETVVRDLQKLVELRTQGLAQLQQQATPTPSAAPVVPAPTVAPAETVAPSGEADGEEALPDVRDLLNDEPATAVAAAPATGNDAPQERVAAPPPVAKATPAPVEVAPPVRPAPSPAPAPAPATEPSMLDFILGDPMLLAGGGSIAILLLGFAAYRMRQRRKDEEDGDGSLSALSEDQSGSHSVFGVKGGQSVDTGASSVLHTDFSQSGLSAIDADEGVDPVAEADVYMAYGRDAQAEEILLDALKVDSSRPAIYLKLLEVYAARPSVKQFEAVATDFYSRTGGHGDEWKKASEMGRKIDPANPLYAESTRVRVEDAPITETSKEPPVVDAGSTGAVAGVAGVTAAGLVAAAAAQADQGAERPMDVSLADLDFTNGPVEPSASQLKATWTVPGDLRQLGEAVENGGVRDVANALDMGAMAPEPEENLLPEDLSVLDFDLDATPEPVPVPEEARPAAKSSETASGGLTFDLDIDADQGLAFDATPAVPEAPAGRRDISLDRTVVGTELDLDLAQAGADISLEFDAPAAPVKPSLAKAGTGREGVRERPAVVTHTSGSEDASLRATVIQSDSLMMDDDSSEMDLEKTGFDNSLLDFDFDLDSSIPEQVAEVRPLDLSNIDLNLELPDIPGSPLPEVPASAIDDITVDEAPSILSDASQEVDTKLDLARAYEEMGDKEGARELIEEVIREGNPAQVAKANALLAQLG